MNSEFLKIFYSITTFQLFFFGLMVFAFRPKREFHNWLGIFLLIKAGLIGIHLLLGQYAIIEYNRTIGLINVLLEYSLCPVFYQFVLKICGEKFQLNYQKIFFLLPIAIGTVFLYLPHKLWEQHWRIFHQSLIINYYSQAIIYTFLAFRHYKNFQSGLGAHFSEESIYRASKLKLVIVGFTFLYLTSCFSDLIRLYIHGNYAIVDFMMEVVFLILINLFLFLGARYPKNISEFSKDLSFIQNKPSQEKYLSSTLSETSKKEILQKLNLIMKGEEFFKTPSLSLKTLAIELDIQSKHLSQVINENFEQNFCEYINTLRIENAKKQLSDPLNNRKTVLEIIYDTGFNSKSVFNSVFKKKTGTTPTAYRTAQKNNINQKLSAKSYSVN